MEPFSSKSTLGDREHPGRCSSTFNDTVQCLLCKMACINPVPFGISEWLDRYSDYPRAQLDNGSFTNGVHCPSDAFYCSTCHIVFTRRVFTEHRLLTMLANRDEFEWQERIDGPNFGSLATRICHVPFETMTLALCSSSCLF